MSHDDGEDNKVQPDTTERGDQPTGDKPLVVLRSYDNRVRASLRNAGIYLNENCQKIVGIGKTFNVAAFGGPDKEILEELEVQANMNKTNPLETVLWEQIGKRNITILSTPYRRGRHYATTPKAFVPVIQQLKKLHAAGFVHGDIRAYNIVFGENPEEGWLIDFDYGGRIGDAVYPRGYNQSLPDGRRIGKEGAAIQAMDDWFALGKVIFGVHKMTKVENQDVKEFWEDVTQMPLMDQIQQLEDFLRATNRPVEFDMVFKREIKENEQIDTKNPAIPMTTVQGATGTPVKKK
jgi:hypothetical protein